MDKTKLDRNKLPIVNAQYLWERILLIESLFDKCNCAKCKEQILRHIKETKNELKTAVR